jgi:undecaprenyl-diphosphatase
MDALLELDQMLFFWINGYWSHSTLDMLAPLATHSGGPTAAFVFLLVVLGITRSGGPLLFAALTYGVNVGVYKIMKYSALRIRPFDALPEAILRLEPEMTGATDPSFPSGHSAIAFMMAAFLAARYPRLTPVFFLWALAVGLSRVYLGLHYPSDVVVGAVVGLLSVMLVLGTAKKLDKADAWLVRD